PCASNVQRRALEPVEAFSPFLLYIDNSRMLQHLHMPADGWPAAGEALNDLARRHGITTEVHDEEDLAARWVIECLKHCIDRLKLLSGIAGSHVLVISSTNGNSIAGRPNRASTSLPMPSHILNTSGNCSASL